MANESEQADLAALRSAQPQWKKDGFGIRGPQLPEQRREVSRFGDLTVGRVTAEVIPPH